MSTCLGLYIEENIIKYAIEENNLSKSDIDEVIQLLQKIYKVNVNLNTTIYVVTYKNIN